MDSQTLTEDSIKSKLEALNSHKGQEDAFKLEYEYLDDPYEASVEDFEYFGPRETAENHFIGAEVKVPKGVSHGTQPEHFIKNYCHEILKCTTDDIVWATVIKHAARNPSFSLKYKGYSFSNGVGGFIYMTKDEIREKYGVKRVTSKIREKVIAQFEKDLELYTTWFNSNIYDAFLLEKNEDGEYSEFSSVFGLDDTTKVTRVCRMLDESLQELKKSCAV